MGNPKPRQEHLATKLLTIRNALGLSQIQLVKRMGMEGTLAPSRISEYETGRREPSLWVLLAYGRAAGVHIEEIIDDRLRLPEKLPGKVKYQA
jgi:transcriptional regulator with XRE-family HTH domain